jgi:hypothetical protein
MSVQSSSPPAISRVRLILFVAGPTRAPERLLELLSVWAEPGLHSPTWAGSTERQRVRFDPNDLKSATEDLNLWREQDPPTFWGVLDVSPKPIARLVLNYEAPGADWQELRSGVDELVARWAPEYAALQPLYSEPDAPSQAPALAGLDARALDYRKCGPPGVFAQTYFGGQLLEALLAKLGRDRLEGLGARLQAWGGYRLCLDDTWRVSYAELRAEQLKRDAELRQSGLFGDYSGSGTAKRGQAWTPLL